MVNFQNDLIDKIVYVLIFLLVQEIVGVRIWSYDLLVDATYFMLIELSS